jgi:D-alanyl-D-alanine carboxypeptidase (penicillin-binding protein 5/6)
MNNKAKELNLENTNFVTPHGLDDENHYTTAYDLAILTNYALKNEKFKEIVSTKTYTMNFNGYPRVLSNTNELLGNTPGVYGVKTGFTFEAGRCLVSACSRDDMDIIVVVLGADTKKIRTQDSSNLINYIFKNYDYVDISNVINESFENYITYFNENYTLEKTTDIPELELSKLENYSFPLKNSDAVKLSTKIYATQNFSYSLKENSKVGTLELYNNDNLLCSLDITLKNSLSKNSWKYYFKNILQCLF